MRLLIISEGIVAVFPVGKVSHLLNDLALVYEHT